MTDTSPEPESSEEDELLHREVERLLEMWDDEPTFQKLKKGGQAWN